MRTLFPIIVKDMLKKTIAIETKYKMGTGFCLDENGLAATCRHILEDSHGNPVMKGKAHVPKLDGKGYTIHDFTIERTDISLDFALIQIEDAKTLPIQMYDGISEVGVDVGVTGFPFGPYLKHATTTKGIISAIHLDENTNQPLYQVDVWLYEAGSGSPCYLAENGEVLGYMTTTFDPYKKFREGIDVRVGVGFVGPQGRNLLERPTNISWAVPIITACATLKLDSI